MRELERSSDISPAPRPFAGSHLAIVGRGHVATALADALSAAPATVSEPLGHDANLTGYDAVVLCVPDGAIAAAAAAVPPGPLVGHCSGATGLAVLGLREAFSLHPLMTFPAGSGGERFAGAGAAIAGTSPGAIAYARELALAVGADPFTLDEADRVAYHAAASVASNFLVALEAAAERIASGTGLQREQLAPLVRATVDNWAALGPERALTGPIARGDELTVAAHRSAIAERAPELLGLYDMLAEVTRSVAAGPVMRR